MVRIILCVLISSIYLSAQDSEEYKFSLDVGAGLGLVEGHSGYALDMEFNYHVSRLFFGFNTNMMTSLREENPHPQWFTLFYEDIPDIVLGDVRFRYSELRTQNSIGLHIGYKLLSKEKFSINTSIGLNHNWYRNRRIVENYENNFATFIAIDFIRLYDIGKYASMQFLYNLNPRVFLGFRIKILDHKDYNLNFLPNLTIKF